MTTQFNTDLLQRFIAPEINTKLNVQLADLSAEFKNAEVWFTHYFLNSVFNGSFTGEMRLYAESIVARIQFLFGGYDEARKRTLEYAKHWQVGAPGIGRYLAAVREWESVFLNLQIIYDLMKKCFNASISGRQDRTWQIANRIKHGSEDIQNGKAAETGLPMWLTSVGFATVTTSVTFSEIEAQVSVMAKIAECLSVPHEAKRRFIELDKVLAEDPNYKVFK